MDKKAKIPGSGGNYLVPYKERTGEESEVYFTRDLSPEGLKRIYDKVCDGIFGKTAVKLHTGEKNGPNIIPSAWVQQFMKERLPEAAIVERILIMKETDIQQSSIGKH